MSQWESHTGKAKQWFEDLRDQICAAFESIERDAGSDASFEYTPWQREEEGNDDPGGGVQGLMKGKVFEKVGVNVSTVRGAFSEQFAAQVNGASVEPRIHSNRHQPCRAYAQPACASGAHEHALPHHAGGLVWRRR